MRLFSAIAGSGARVIAPDGDATAAEICARAERLASTFATSRARIALLAPPGIEFLTGLFAAFVAGRPCVVLSPLHTDAELASACARARVDAVLASSLAARAPVRAIPIEPGTAAVRVDVREDDDALLLFTSGTTAQPKAARLTHANLWAHARVLHEAWRWSASDRLVHALPLHHLHGIGTALLTALAIGATVEMLPRFEPHAVWDAIARANVYMGVPTTIAKLVSAFEAADEETRARWRDGARGLRLVTNGSAALPPDLSRRFELITGVQPLERFGMTECGVATTQSLDGPRRAGVSGRAVPGMEVRVVDEQGRAIADPPKAGRVSAIVDAEGEIEVRGAGVFPGYDDDAANASVFRDDGFFRTGDAGVIDANGDLIVRGRLSVDVLKSGGYKLSALEIEAAIRECADVEEVAVVGVPDAEWGDLVTAVVVPRAGAALDVEALRAFVRERLASYKVPRRWVVRTALPRNSIGKVVKPALVAELK